MRFALQIRRSAEFEVAEAQLWYETQRSGLGAEFLSEVSRRFLIDLRKLRRYIKPFIEMSAEQLSIIFHISSGIELLTRW